MKNTRTNPGAAEQPRTLTARSMALRAKDWGRRAPYIITQAEIIEALELQLEKEKRTLNILDRLRMGIKVQPGKHIAELDGLGDDESEASVRENCKLHKLGGFSDLGVYFK